MRLQDALLQGAGGDRSSTTSTVGTRLTRRSGRCAGAAATSPPFRARGAQALGVEDQGGGLVGEHDGAGHQCGIAADGRGRADEEHPDVEEPVDGDGAERRSAAQEDGTDEAVTEGEGSDTGSEERGEGNERHDNVPSPLLDPCRRLAGH